MKIKKKKKKKELKIEGGSSHSLRQNSWSGVVEPPPHPRGWSGHPKMPKKIELEKWVLGFGGGRTTPKDLGCHPIPVIWSHPRFLSFFSFFFSDFHLFLK
jgi:hypothetical protein